METPIVKGLNRSAKYLGLPTPFLLAAVFSGFMPFMITDIGYFLFLIPINWGVFWVINIVNPGLFSLIFVIFTKTPKKIFMKEISIE